DAHLHGVDEIDRAPSPDTTLLVRGDVRHVEYAERRVQAASASERRLVLGFGAVAFLQRLSVTLRAAARDKHVFAVFDVRLMCGQRRGRNRARHRQNKEDSSARDGKNQKRQQDPAQALLPTLRRPNRQWPLLVKLLAQRLVSLFSDLRHIVEGRGEIALALLCSARSLETRIF